MKHLRCQASALLIALALAGQAGAHWTIASALTAADGVFRLTLHYEVLAGQSNPDEPLRICFWLERHEQGRFAPVTRRACERLTLKAAEWKTLVYRPDRLDALPETGGGSGVSLTRGQYRAVALIGSDAGWLARLIWGASEERKLLPFEVRD
jgi:hypothetical protein